MRLISIEPTFESWREAARSLIAEGVKPDEVTWTDSSTLQEELFSATGHCQSHQTVRFTVGRTFLKFAKMVACHADSRRWAILYELLWRQVANKERHLLGMVTDSTVSTADALAKEVRRDIHKMRAFVRFRKVGETASGREQFVAWFEPLHRIVRINAPFFAKRFAGIDWSILTPQESAHWDGKRIHFGPAVPKSAAPDEDELERLWLGYYKSIFNPARLKLKAMRAEMPAKYWKNLPEASLIREMTAEAAIRRDRMLDRDSVPPVAAPANQYLSLLSDRNAVPAVHHLPADLADRSLDQLLDLACHCRTCPLWEKATQTVFGEGNPTAEIMLIGEQPGDQEDIAGRPFQGPAGRLLDRALTEAGLHRDEMYITNAVKHFKWKPPARGKRRLHDKASPAEFRACQPWLIGEIAQVSPRVIVTMGNSAAQSVIRPDFRITPHRVDTGGANAVGFSGMIVATVHPSFLLRIKDSETRTAEYARFLSELRRAKSYVN